MIQPRNSMVVLRLITKSSRKVGAITVPTANELFTEAEVMAVGPGSISAEGGRSETFDLKPGQLVFVKHKRDTPRGKIDEFVPYTVDGKSYAMFEQTNILGVLAEPNNWQPDLAAESSLILHS